MTARSMQYNFCTPMFSMVEMYIDQKLLSNAFLAISDQYATFLFFKMAAGGYFGSPIWAILDDRKSLSIAFLTISDQYTTLFF